MESEKVKEIKKALKYNIKLGLSYEDDEKYCKVWLADILNLINELESENERLIAEKQKVLEYMKTDNYAKLKKEDMYWGYQMGIGMLEHEIDRQKDRIAELEKENEVLCVELSRYTENCVEMKNGTLKQFAEMLKEKIVNTPHILGGERTIIDETLKEFISQNN